MTIRLTGDWNKAETLLATAEARLQRASDKALMREANYLRREIVLGIRSQAPGGKRFKPLAEATLRARRARGFTGTKALIVTGDLRNSIKVTKLGKIVFVGILRTVRGRGGQELVNIGAVHEFGSRDGRIPARPFLRPEFDAWLPKAKERFEGQLAKALGGDYGTAKAPRD